LIDIPENIHADYLIIFQLPFGGILLDKTKHGGIFFHNGEVVHAPGSQFVADAARSAKEVERPERRQIQVILQDVEQAFFCNIGCRPGMGHFGWRMDAPAAQFTTDYAHTAIFRMEEK
jgi:hypothetical protein